jgi:hypothetical protein
MFKLDDVGKTITIKNTQGHKSVKKNAQYVITQVFNAKTARLNDTINWICNNSTDFEVLGIENEYEIGDEVVLKSSTTSLDKGHKGKILDFYDDGRKKLVVEGVIPGGWIDSTKVFKLLDPTKYRVKTLCELIRDIGITFFSDFGKPSKFTFSTFGKNLCDIGKVAQTESHFIIVYDNREDTILENYMICSKDIPPFNCKIIIKKEKEIIDLIGPKNEWKVLPHAGKDITEVYTNLHYDKPVSMYDFFKNIAESGYNDGKCKITNQLLQLETEVNEDIAPILPF